MGAPAVNGVRARWMLRAVYRTSESVRGCFACLLRVGKGGSPVIGRIEFSAVCAELTRCAFSLSQKGYNRTNLYLTDGVLDRFIKKIKKMVVLDRRGFLRGSFTGFYIIV